MQRELFRDAEGRDGTRGTTECEGVAIVARRSGEKSPHQTATRRARPGRRQECGRALQGLQRRALSRFGYAIRCRLTGALLGDVRGRKTKIQSREGQYGDSVPHLPSLLPLRGAVCRGRGEPIFLNERIVYNSRANTKYVRAIIWLEHKSPH
jgi:hypothetical protein